MGLIDPRTTRRTSKVQFARNVRVKLIRPLGDMSRDEADAMWFTAEECQRMEAEVGKAVMRLRSAVAADAPSSSSSLDLEHDNGGNGDEHCPVGLDYVCDHEAYEAHIARVEAGIESVLTEQGRQLSLENAIVDEDALARVYAEAAAPARAAARMRGLQYLVDDSDQGCNNERRCEIDKIDNSDNDDEVNTQMAVAASTDTSFKRAERRGLAQAGEQQRLRDVSKGTPPHGDSSPTLHQSDKSFIFLVPVVEERPSSSRSREEPQRKSGSKKVDVAVKNFRSVTARIAMSGRCAMPFRPKPYIALGA